MIETVWYKKLWDWLKSGITLVSRVMKLEERVSALEKKIETLQVPPKSIREGLDYNKERNYLEDKATGECFCPACLGNGKKIAVHLYHFGWSCPNCKARREY